jgi:TPR repeat protein
VIANEEMAKKHSYHHMPCCGKSICGGCVHSVAESGNNNKCPFCNSESKSHEEDFEDTLKRVEANDPASICLLARYYLHGREGLQQNEERAMELYKQAAGLGSNDAHYQLGEKYYEGGDLKKAKLHLEAAAMAGHEVARFMLGIMENKSGNRERAIKHWKIAASAGYYLAMHALITFSKKGTGRREAINSTLVAYNDTCSEMRSEARDTYIHTVMERL